MVFAQKWPFFQLYFFRQHRPGNTRARHTVRRLNQMSRQCRSEVELIQLGSAHEKYGV